MRIHISLDEDLVAELDARVGRRQRSRFIESTVRRALDDERRWEAILAGIGSLSDDAHDWDADPGDWVQQQRRSDPSRVG